MRLLVEAGADVNAKERLRGTTALMWAVEQRHPEAVEVLLAAGADHGAKSGGAGLPRNYLAQRVNTRAVEEAQKRHERAEAAGRTYEEQLEWEYENNVDLGASRNAFTPEPRARRRRRCGGRGRRGSRPQRRRRRPRRRLPHAAAPAAAGRRRGGSARRRRARGTGRPRQPAPRRPTTTPRSSWRAWSAAAAAA